MPLFFVLIDPKRDRTLTLNLSKTGLDDDDDLDRQLELAKDLLNMSREMFARHNDDKADAMIFMASDVEMLRKANPEVFLSEVTHMTHAEAEEMGRILKAYPVTGPKS